MKSMQLLLLCATALAATAPKTKLDVFYFDSNTEATPENRNLWVNILVNTAINILRSVIKNGSPPLNIPPLDPLELAEFHLSVPIQIFNAEIYLKNALVSGLGDFKVHTSKLTVPDLTLNVDVSIPRLYIYAENYDFTGDLFNVIPLYGNGGAEFVMENLRIAFKAYLKQSDDGQSVIIDKVEGATFDIPSFKSKLSGVIGGGDIDAIVNALIEDVVISYVNRFRGAISNLVATNVVRFANPVLEQLDTWKYFERFL